MEPNLHVILSIYHQSAVYSSDLKALANSSGALERVVSYDIADVVDGTVGPGEPVAVSINRFLLFHR